MYVLYNVQVYTSTIYMQIMVIPRKMSTSLIKFIFISISNFIHYIHRFEK